MANVKDLIVNGAARIIGKTYSSEFVGKLTGNVTGNVTGNLTGNVTGDVSGSSGSCTGNAATSSKLKTAVSLTTTDGTNTSTGVNFDGSAATSIKLPTTIKATFSGNLTGDVTGNVSGSSGSCTGNAATATKATNDSANQQINITYIKGLSVDGKTITYTKGNDSTGTITTQDTTYTVASGDNNGQIKITPSSGDAYNVSVKGLGSRAYDSTDYLALAGGTVTGVTSFTDTTPSDSITTGAVKISGGLGVQGNIYGSKVYGCVWNDLADCIDVPENTDLEYGYCYCFDGKNYYKSTGYLDDGIIGIHSDTAGFHMGKRENEKQMNVAVAGFVLAYVDKEYPVGTPLTCKENGILTKLKEEDISKNPHKIVGTFWKAEPNEFWGAEGKEVEVNGRKWVKVK